MRNRRFEMRILIADDNPDDRILAVRELKKEFADLEVVEILSKEDLEKALENFNFDAVITDYRLRWGTGFDVLKAVKQVSPFTPVIMLTLTGDEEIAVEAMKEGFDDYVLKSPKHIRRLPLAVKNAIEKKKREKEIEEAYRKLEESERRYRDLWENANDFLYVHDLEGRFTAVNRAAIEGFGYSPEDLGKFTIWDLLVSDSAELVKERMKRTLQSEPNEEPFEVLCKTKDGRLLWLEVKTRPIYENGKLVGVQGIARDVTKRKEYEEEIKRLNRLLRIVNDINDLLVRERDADDLVEAIVEKLSEFYPSVFVGVAKDGEMVFYPKGAEGSECVKEAITSKRTVRLEPDRHIKGCKHISVHGSFYALTIPMVYDEKVKGVIIIHSDRPFSEDEVEILTTLSADVAFALNAIQLEEEKFLAYEQIERNIEQFAILVDHIRNPLAALQLITEMEVEDEKVRKKIIEQVKRIEKLIRDLDRGWIESEVIREFLRKTWER